MGKWLMNSKVISNKHREALKVETHLLELNPVCLQAGLNLCGTQLTRFAFMSTKNAFNFSSD